MDERVILEILKISFANDDIKRQVLNEEWYSLNIQNKIDSTGFCFTASEIIYRMTGGSNVWKILSINDPNDWNKGSHYFLIRKSNNEIIDITSNQYTSRGIKIPYEKGRARGLRFVSRKAKLLSRLSGLGEL